MENKYFIIIGAGLFIVLLIVGLVVVLSRPKQSKPKEQTEPITLTVWRLFDKEDSFKQIFEEYRMMNPHVTIKYELKDVADYEEMATNAIAAGKGPDIWSIPNDWMVKHRDKLVPAPEELLTETQYREQFVDIVAEESIAEGKIWGMPLYVDPLVLYYNLEVMIEALNRLRKADPNKDYSRESQILSRPPAFWDDLVSAVKLITQRSGNSIVVSGLAMGTADNTHNAPAILQALMLQNGAKMTNVDKTAASFHLPDKTQAGQPYYSGVEALDFYTAFAKPDRAVYSWNDRAGSSLDAFMSGRAAMMINFQYVQQDLKQRAPTLYYDVAPLPQIKGSTTPANVASYMMETVTKNSAHPEAAWGLVKFMTSPQRVSTYRTAARRPSALRSQSEGPDALPQGIRSAKAIYKPDAKKYDEIFREMIRGVIELKQPPQTAVEVAANKVTQLLLSK